MAPPTTPIESSPSSPIAPPGFSLDHPLNTPKTTPPPLSSPPPAPSQPSKYNSPLAINLEPIEFIFSTPPTSPHPFFDSFEDLPHRTANPPPPQPMFKSIERLAKQPPPLPEVMEPPLPPFLPQLPPHSQPMWSTNDFPSLTHEMFYEHYLVSFIHHLYVILLIEEMAKIAYETIDSSSLVPKVDCIVSVLPLLVPLSSFVPLKGVNDVVRLLRQLKKIGD
ncbi:hypothetical protein Tco_1284857 [Tanacetum coccineum]